MMIKILLLTSCYASDGRFLQGGTTTEVSEGIAEELRKQGYARIVGMVEEPKTKVLNPPKTKWGRSVKIK